MDLSFLKVRAFEISNNVIREINMVFFGFIINLNREKGKKDFCREALFLFFYGGVLLIFISPGLVPQPEPYFDLTPIRVTHTKIA